MLKRKTKIIFANMILLLISTIASLLLSELLIRNFLPVYDPSGNIKFHLDHNGLCLAQKNFEGKMWMNTGEYNVGVTTNKHGFRDKKDIKDSDYKDIFIVGDSFTFGYGVEEPERFSNIVENLTATKVYNIGIPGDIDEYIKLLDYAEKNGAKISNLIIGLCMENDLKEYDKITKENSDLLLRKVKGFLFGNSALFRLIAEKIYLNDRLRNLAIKINLIDKQFETIPTLNYSEELINQSVSKIIPLNKRYNLLVCIISSRGLWIGPETARQEQLKIHTFFIKALRKNNIRTVDLKEVFEKAPGVPMDYHFKYDGHWNTNGHKLAAQTICKNLK